VSVSLHGPTSPATCDVGVELSLLVIQVALGGLGIVDDLESASASGEGENG